MMMTPKRKSKAGAPVKKFENKKQPDGLTNAQHTWLRKEATGRNTTVASVKQEAIDWYITAIEAQRGDSDTHKLFDDILTNTKK